jgi:hypothetical protein
MLPTKFMFIWSNGFRGRDFFLEIGQSETRIVCGSHTYDGLGRNEQSL